MLNVILIVIDVASAFGLIFLILLHSGRGGGLSDMFGGGQLGGSMAGSTVVERNLDRLTVITFGDLHVLHRAARPPPRISGVPRDGPPARLRTGVNKPGHRWVELTPVCGRERLKWLKSLVHRVVLNESAVHHPRDVRTTTSMIGGDAGGHRCTQLLSLVDRGGSALP
jgi:preprotein translocase subunit SecG